MRNYILLLELFNEPKNTQLMKQSVNLYALMYYKIFDLLLIQSYLEKKEDKFINPLFTAPAQVHKIEKIDSNVELTIRALKDEHDAIAIELIRNLLPNEIEIAYSHIKPQFLSPKIHGPGWDNWSFSYSLPIQERIEKRREKTISKARKLYASLQQYDFNQKKILFLGCGDGDEIEAFLNTLNVTDAKIVGIDQSAAAISNCGSIKDKYANHDISFLRLNLENVSEISGEKFDFIFALGLFDRETLSFEDGQGILQNIRSNLTFDTFIVSGYSFELFTRANYQDLGFDVMATCEPSTMYTNNSSFFYVLKKASQSTKKISDQVSMQSLEFHGSCE